MQTESDRTRDDRLDAALAYILASTKCTRRTTNLLKTAKSIALARRVLGGLSVLAQKVGVSCEMLRQFAAVERLSPAVKGLVSARRITSVDTAYRLSRLDHTDQEFVANELVSGRISGKEVRDLVSFHKRNPDVPAREIVERLRSFRQVVRYLIKVPVPAERGAEFSLRSRLLPLLGERNIVSVQVGGQIGTVIISEEGQKRLQAEAKRRGVTRKQLVMSSITEG